MLTMLWPMDSLVVDKEDRYVMVEIDEIDADDQGHSQEVLQVEKDPQVTSY